MNKISQIRCLMTEKSIPYEMQDKWVSPKVGLVHCPAETGSMPRQRLPTVLRRQYCRFLETEMAEVSSTK